MTAAEIALRAQPLPDVIDLSIILTGSGLGGLVGALAGALHSSTWTASAERACWERSWAA